MDLKTVEQTTDKVGKIMNIVSKNERISYTFIITALLGVVTFLVVYFLQNIQGIVSSYQKEITTQRESFLEVQKDFLDTNTKILNDFSHFIQK